MNTDQGSEPPVKDFFISYNRADRTWAEWLAWILEEGGYSVVIQAWDFRPGGNFVLEMHRAARNTRYTAMVLSQDYLDGEYTHPEWAAAFVQDPQGRQRKLIPFRVAECTPDGLLSTIIYVDLVGMEKDEAKAAVLAVLEDRLKPDREPDFPGSSGPGDASAAVKLDIARLPVTGEHFVGRADHLARLDAAWDDDGIHVLSLVAWGGVGKSALVNRWLAGLAQDDYRGAVRVMGWAFYSQGTDEDRVASADAFIDHALGQLRDADPSAGSARDRGLRLAALLRRERTLLVLDGVEPLQHPTDSPLAGRLKDPALAALLRELAAGNPGLCVVTTRERVDDLASSAATTAPRIDLEELSPAAGAELLRRLGVDGTDEELRAASAEFGGHALALTLLGIYLRKAHGGDVRCRREVPLGKASARQGGHAYRVIAAYERWLGTGPELGILRLLGLFDRPAPLEAVAALRAAPVIPGLTESLTELHEDDWQWALANLREHGLLARTSSGAGVVDAHPLVRSYFADQLREQHPDAWRAGNLRLYLLTRVEIDPEVMLGKPVIRGTRITLEIILEKIAAGCSFDEILEEYPRLSHADVLAAVAYARQAIGTEEIIPRLRAG